eukprot:TRINITY_DN3330_c0_g1_i1.p1 TRINITY_DN3330_c0_g1~~TRINITY_DN3330_c0_g1_i1.p1  ORF type:complete len:1040 (-),score=250.66 TRINITY_DN3330_c0_g1_i1:70-3189(-)
MKTTQLLGSWILIVSIFLFVGFQTTSADVGRGVYQGCDLACWLNFTFRIPDQTFTKTILGLEYNMTIVDIYCSQNQIGIIDSKFLPPTDLVLNLSQIATNCQANYTIRHTSFPPLNDAGGVFIYLNDSRLDMQVHLVQSSSGLAVAANLSKCETVLNIADMVFVGDFQEILNLFKPFIESEMQTQIDKLACEGLQTGINGNLTEMLQTVDQKINTFMDPNREAMILQYPPHIKMMDLLQNQFVDVVTACVTNLMSPQGLLPINMLFDRLTNNTGEYVVPDKYLAMAKARANVTQFGSIEFGLVSASASGLATWGDINLHPAESKFLLIHTETNSLSLNVTFYLNISTTLTSQWLYEEANLQVNLTHNNLKSQLEILVREVEAQNLQLMQMQYRPCLSKVLYDASMVQLVFNTSVDDIKLTAMGGSLEKALDKAIDDTLSLFTTSFRPAIPAFFNGYASDFIMEEVNGLVRKFVDTNETCPPPPEEKDTFNKMGTVAAFGGAGGLFAAIAFAALIPLIAARVRRSSEDRKSRMKHTSTVEETDTEDNQPLLQQPIFGETDAEKVLILNPRLPVFVRFLIPLLILINVAMFISSNVSVGASIYMKAQIGDRTFVTPSLFDFSLGDSVRQMWDAKVYALAILIGVFSGAWPYIKLLMMLLSWILPTKLISTKRRETLLMILDALGKWSLVDSFVMVLMMVAFRFHVVYPLNSQEGYPDPIIDVFVRPDYGFYGFLFATAISLVLTHIILALHHRATTIVYRSPTFEDDRHPLCNDEFEVGQRRYACATLGKIVVCLSLVVISGLLGAGLTLDAFNFEFEGAAGYLMKELGIKTEQPYSAVSLGLNIPPSSEFPNSFGIRSIQSTFFAFIVAMPICHMFTMLMLWIVPTRNKAKSVLFFLSGVFNAWCALEVFVVSVIAAILEIGQFTDFIIGDKCDAINPILVEYFPDWVRDVPKCVQIQAQLNQGCWWLYSASIIYLITALIVMRLCGAVLETQKKDMTIQNVNNDAHITKDAKGSIIMRGLMRVSKALRLIRENIEEEAL